MTTRANGDWHEAIPPYVTSRDPMDQEEHNSLTRDVAFNRMSFGMQDTHTSPYDNATVQVGTDGIEVRLIQGINEDAMAKTLAACEQATIGLEIADIEAITGRPDETNEMFKGGLQTALETQVIVFAVRGVSRTCTHQLVRTRKASFHQQSQRASFMGDAPEVRIPESVWRAGMKVQNAWLAAIYAAHHAYRAAVEANVSYQDARFILPEGTDTFILLEYPVREFLNVYAYRACSMFQWEISHTMRLCREELIKAHPWIEPYVKITCERTSGAIDRTAMTEERMRRGELPRTEESFKHTCMFQGWEEVEPQCDFPWARETNRQFRSERHNIKQKG